MNIRAFLSNTFFVASLTASSILVSTSNVNAEKLEKTVKANHSSYLTGMALFSRRTCLGQRFPKLSRWSADHGKVSIRKIKQKIAKGKRCAGNTFYYAVVDYTPKRGYRGKDTAKFTLTGPRWADGSGHRANNYTVDITVK